MQRFLAFFFALALTLGAIAPAQAHGILTSDGPASSTAGGNLTTGSQDIAGNKKFIGTTSTGPAIFAEKLAEASIAEECARFGISGLTSDYLSILNGSASAVFLPTLLGANSTTNVALTTIAQGATDTGTNPIMRFLSRIGATTIPSTRPSFLFALGNTSSVLELTARGKFNLTPVAASSGAVSAFVITPPNDNAQTLSTEIPGFVFNAFTRSWATGALTTQREFLVKAPTYAFTGASTITDAATLVVDAAPIAGTNATLTRSAALWVQAGLTRLGGGMMLASRVATATPITVATSDYIVVSKLAAPGAVAVSLPASPETGRIYIVKDGTGDAAANNITITPAAGNIDGAGTKVISTNYGSVRLVYSGTEWLSY